MSLSADLPMLFLLEQRPAATGYECEETGIAGGGGTDSVRRLRKSKTLFWSAFSQRNRARAFVDTSSVVSALYNK